MTIPRQQPPLDVHAYHVQALVFKAHNDYKPEQTSSGEIDVDFQVQKDEVKPNVFRIDMRIQLAASGYTPDENTPYSIDLTIVGYLSFASATSEEVMNRMIFINGPAILFGIARGIVGQATGASKHGQFVLPTVNFVAMEKERTKRDEDEQQLALQLSQGDVEAHPEPGMEEPTP